MSAWPTSTPVASRRCPLDGVKPSVATVRGHTYALARSTFYYTNGPLSGAAQQFLDYTLSPAGQAIVAQVGFVPLH